MSYLIILLTSLLFIAIGLHLYSQFRQTGHIREALAHARASKTLRGMHSLRNNK